MRYLPVYLYLLLFLNINSTAQVSTISNTLKQEKFSDILTQKEFKELLKKEFFFLANSDAPTSISNFASLETKDGRVTLQTNFFLNRGIFENSDIILGIQANGAGSTESLPIYSENEFNSNIGVEVELKLPNYVLAKIINSKDKASIEYKDSEKTQRDINIRKIDETYDIDVSRIRNERQLFEFRKEINKKESEIEKLDKEISSINKKVNKDYLQLIEMLNERNPNEFLIDSLRESIASNLRQISLKNFDHKEKTFEIDEIKFKVLNLPSEDDLFWTRRGKWLKDREKEKANLNPVGHDVSWLSIGYGFSNTKFKLFNPSLSFEEQKLDTSYLSHRFEIGYSRSSINFLSRKSFFFSLGAAIEITDNRESGLSSQKITERTNYGVNPNDRYSISDINILVGDYKTDLSNLSFFGDYYRFLFSSTQSALHGRFELRKENDLKLQTNVGIGLVTSLLNKDKEKSIINVELFWGIEDFSRVNIDEGNVFDRSSIALRFSVPFNYNKSK